jgi:hypothetical protein
MSEDKTAMLVASYSLLLKWDFSAFIMEQNEMENVREQWIKAHC